VSKVAGHNPGMRHPNLSLVLGGLSSELKALYRERFVGLWLYGSEARGDASAESDIDVLLVLTRLDRPALEIDRYAGILADINLRHGVLLSVMPVAQSQLLESNGPFCRNARSDGVAA
jgi:predicted nucleotidyltransferase